MFKKSYNLLNRLIRRRVQDFADSIFFTYTNSDINIQIKELKKDKKKPRNS